MSAPYGELVVVLGDAHVGQRASDVPDKFKKMLTPDKMQHLVSTGNLCASETYEFFRSVAPIMHAVRGDMDDYTASMTSAEELVFEVGEFRIGVCHGHQIVPWGDRDALALVARRLDVDILITGHTHVCEAFEVEGTWFVNPGSITGAYTPLRDDVKPSFVLLSIQANSVKLYMYELNPLSGEVDIHRARFTKPSAKNPFSSSIPAPPPTAKPTPPAPAVNASPASKQTPTPAPVVNSPPVPKQTATPTQASPSKVVNPGPPVPKRPQHNAVPTVPSTSIEDSVSSERPSAEKDQTSVEPPVQKRAPPPRPPAEPIPEERQVLVEPPMETKNTTEIARKIDEELNLADSASPSASIPEPAFTVFDSLSDPPAANGTQTGHEIDLAQQIFGAPAQLEDSSAQVNVENEGAEIANGSEGPLVNEEEPVADEEHWDDV